ncbi:DUF4349 domain-containing protein [Hahella sp. NBU794]|uniref:DUF4349 domain-containing protein n=1 Tax=Hahella sp. NBU794 TaxID=3422590 RepID=UPI003D6E9433
MKRHVLPAAQAGAAISAIRLSGLCFRPSSLFQKEMISMQKPILRRFMWAILMLTLAACSPTDYPGRMQGDASLRAESAQRESNPYLAYEHSVRARLQEDKIAATHQQIMDACAADRENHCTLLDADLNREYARASLRLRIKPAGVKPILQQLAQAGDVTQVNTHVEDLAASIVDAEKQVEMLTSYRDRLLELEKRSADNIDSLIKIASQLAQTQAELEQAMGDNAYLLQRVNMDILNISFDAEHNESFWNPISRSLSSFSEDLSEAISEVITAFAYLLPWLVMLSLLFFPLRFIWRKLRRR